MFWSVFYNGVCLCTFFCNNKERAEAFCKAFKKETKKEASLFEGFTPIQATKVKILVYDKQYRVLTLANTSTKTSVKLRKEYLRITEQTAFSKKFQF